MNDFRADDQVGNISPRPLLLLHSANDSVTPTEQSVDLFMLAGQPTDLHLVANTDHFLMSEDNPRVLNLVRDWLDRYHPVRARARMRCAAPRSRRRSWSRPTAARFRRAAFAAAGLANEHARAVADVLVWANLRGIDTHGVSRMPRYVECCATAT